MLSLISFTSWSATYSAPYLVISSRHSVSMFQVTQLEELRRAPISFNQFGRDRGQSILPTTRRVPRFELFFEIECFRSHPSCSDLRRRKDHKKDRQEVPAIQALSLTASHTSLANAPEHTQTQFRLVAPTIRAASVLLQPIVSAFKFSSSRTKYHRIHISG